MPFTDRQIAALKPKTQRYEKKESGHSGLGIRISPKGIKTWTFVYRFHGSQKRMMFGIYPRVGLAAARIALADAKDKLGRGLDPGAIVAKKRQVERDAETVDDLVEEYLERHARKNMKPATAAEDERLLRREILPAWSKRRAKDISRRDIIRVLDGIEDRGISVTRNRVASVLSRLFLFAMDRGIVDASPAVGIRRLKEVARDRFLTLEEIRSFWHGLDAANMTPPVRTALRLLLITGQRRSEVAGTARAEIDDDEQLWRLPAVRAKPGRENLIPLPPLAMRLIEEADHHRVRPIPTRPNRKDRMPYDPTPSPWLFPSTRHGKPVERAALTRAWNRNRGELGIGDAHLHDLRRTFATWHGEIGTQPEVLSALLNHSPKSITEQVYNRSSIVEPRRRAMTVWCSWLERVVAGEPVAENVVPLRRNVTPEASSR
jgi:integrase